MERSPRKIALASLALTVCLGSFYIDDRAHAKEKLALETDRDPAALFDKNCATCHGKDGQAKTFKAKFNHARNLTDAKWQGEVSDERLFNSISNGKGKMPAWGKKFSEGEVNALVAYVRKLKQ